MARNSESPHTHRASLRSFILTTLRDLGGSAEKHVVLANIEQTFGDKLTPADFEMRESRAEEKWKSNASYERNRMKDDGLLVNRADGIWQLTDAGVVEASLLP